MWQRCTTWSLVTVTILGVSATAEAEQLVGVSKIGNTTRLIGFDSESPYIPNLNVTVTGLLPGEELVGLDTRPLTGELYGIGASSTTSHVYVLDLKTGAATAVAEPALTPALTKALLTGFGFDFNPAIDRARIVSDTDENIVIHPDTGAVTATGTSLFYAEGDINEAADPHVVHIAYDNNFDGTSTTQQRGIDSELDILVTVTNNAGTLGTIGPLGIDVTAIGGFDVSPSGTAYALLTRRGTILQRLYTIDLETGAATLVGSVIAPRLDGLTVVPDPVSEPTASSTRTRR